MYIYIYIFLFQEKTKGLQNDFNNLQARKNNVAGQDI